MPKMFEQLDKLKERGLKIKRWQSYGFAVLFPSDGKTISLSEILRITMQLVYDYRSRDDLLFSALSIKDPEGAAIFIYFRDPILRTVNGIVGPHGLRAEVLEGIFSVGVGGDEGTYTPAINLIGPFPGYEILEKVSIEIGNTLPINRVTFQVAAKV